MRLLLILMTVISVKVEFYVVTLEIEDAGNGLGLLITKM